MAAAAGAASSPMIGSVIRLCDIGANMTDPMFKGFYNGKKSHDEDLVAVVERATKYNVQRIIVTGGSLEESREAIELVKPHPNLYCTVGVHPTRCNEFEGEGHTPDEHLQSLLSLIREANQTTQNDDGSTAGVQRKVVAVGECGLDYDRLQFCSKDVQQRYFERQFELAETTGLPLFLHNRNTDGDFARLVGANRSRFRAGVAHSFTGSVDELNELLDLDIYIGVNGCSLKTQENLDVVARIPLDRLLLETDAPWCDIRNTHASMKFVETKFDGKKKERFVMGEMVKGRNEPCCMVQVLEAVVKARGGIETKEELAEAVWQNSMRVFFPEEAQA